MVSVLFTCVCPVLGAQEIEEPVAETLAVHDPSIMMVDAFGNRYGWTGWASLSAAKRAYGYDLNYHQCSVYFSGGYFNYCYDFSDNTKMFFGVKTW